MKALLNELRMGFATNLLGLAAKFAPENAGGDRLRNAVLEYLQRAASARD